MAGERNSILGNEGGVEEHFPQVIVGIQEIPGVSAQKVFCAFLTMRAPALAACSKTASTSCSLATLCPIENSVGLWHGPAPMAAEAIASDALRLDQIGQSGFQ
jgi:hypothetical protein